MWKMRENYTSRLISSRDEHEIFKQSITVHPHDQFNVSWHDNINEWLIVDESLHSYHCAVAGESNSIGSYTHLDQMRNSI